MRADKVEVSWDDSKRKWLIRIVSGEEVIRRFADLAKSADENALRAAAQSTVTEEGYEADAGAIVVVPQSRSTQA